VNEEFGELQTQFTFFMQKEYRKIIELWVNKEFD